MNQPTPAIVAQSAVRRLPRTALLLLCAAYVLAGLLGRGPWKSADVEAFGYMAQLAAGGDFASRWLDPLLLGMRPETAALIPYWIGAGAIQLAPAWLRPDLAVRLAFGLLLWGTLAASWYAMYYLARTPRAQPVAFAFGGEAKPTDYARAMADGALLALLACLGLAQLGHETTPALTQLFFASYLFYGVAAFPYRPGAATLALPVGTAGLALSGAPTLALLLGSGCALLALAERRLAGRSTDADASPVYTARAVATIAASTALAAALAWSLDQLQWRIALPGSHVGASVAGDIKSHAKLLLWFTWPVWPLAIWTLWRWRRQLRARHVALPLLFALVPMGATLTTDFSDRSLLLALPAIATLAALALPTFSRSAAALIDWFTLLLFSAGAIAIWVIWISLQTGVPAKPAANIMRLAPGFTHEFAALPVVFALIGTIAWCWLVRWRTGRHRAALWKTLVLPAGGTALGWLLLMTLMLPPFDYVLSYAPQVRAIAARTGQPACIAELSLRRPQVAALRHHGGFVLKPINSHTECGWLLVNPDSIALLHNIVNLEQWRLIGTFRRRTSASDDLLLYQRSAP